jgi:hypothetical protein
MSFKCPNCGDDDWWEDATAATRQRINLTQHDDGSFTPDYLDPAEIVEEGPTEAFRCRGCDYTIDRLVDNVGIGEGTYAQADEPGPYVSPYGPEDVDEFGNLAI